MAGLKYLESSIVYGNTLYILDWDVENIEMNRDDLLGIQNFKNTWWCTNRNIM